MHEKAIEMRITTFDGKKHEVTLSKNGNGRWQVDGYVEGKLISVAGEPSQQQAIERWKSAYEYGD
jgi:hypothetical protein